MRTWVLVVGAALLVVLALIVSIGVQMLNPPPAVPTPSLIEGVEQVASAPPVVATLRAQVIAGEPWRDGSGEIRVITPTAEEEQ